VAGSFFKGGELDSTEEVTSKERILSIKGEKYL
jgi:hypothetical protein